MAIPNGAYSRNAFGKDEDTCFPRFFKESVQNVIASQQAGREIWEDVEMVEILMPGNLLTRPVCKVTDEHRQRWPKAYELFKREEEYRPEGKPLEEWAVLRPAMVKELKALDFHTIEAVAAMTEQAIQRIGMGARSIKSKAQAYLEEQQGMQPLNDMVTKNELLESRCAALETQNKELGAMLENVNNRLNAMANAPHPLAVATPGQSDPAGAHLYANGAAQSTGARSSLAALDDKPKPTKPSGKRAPAAANA